MNTTAIESIKEAIHQFGEKEKQLDLELSDLLNRQCSVENSMKDLYRKMPNFQILTNETERLYNKINYTSKLASDVSNKIKNLDVAKGLVASCLQRVSDILDLKFCTQNIEKALSNKDYEQAAAHIHRFLSIDENNLRKSALINGNSDQNLNSLDKAFKKLHDAESNLREIILKNFDDSADKNDQANVEKFFKIFPLLNQHELGLRKYSNYLSKNLSRNLQTNLNLESTYINQLKCLYESFASLIDENQVLIETFYGYGYLINFIKILQEECDSNAIKIILSFENSQNLKLLNISIQKLIKNCATNLVRKDPKEIDFILNDIVEINSITEKYLTFIIDRVKQDLKTFGKEEVNYQKKYDDLVSLYKNCKLSRALQEINGTYVLLEEYFIKESSMKAIQIDDLESNNLNSSMLDDIFFILKKSVQRATKSKSIDVLCAIINHCVSLLDSLFYETLNDRLRYGYPITAGITNALDLSQAYNVLQSGRYLGNSSDLEKNRLLYLTALNNLDNACNYINSFKLTIYEDIKKEVNFLRAHELEKLEPCLVEFMGVILKFQNTINSGLIQLCKNILKPKIKNWIDSFLAESHLLSENEIIKYEPLEGLRPFTQEFLVSIDKIINSFKPSLTFANYEGLINQFSVELTIRLEVALKKCNFNKLGAYQFNRELRSLTHYLASLTDWSIRYKFKKINFISEIINLENLNELKIIFPNISTTGLKADEIKQFLKLRTDFSNEDIRKLQL